MNHRVQFRAEQDHVLLDSLAGSSMSALTIAVLAMMATVFLARPGRVIVVPPIWEPPVRNDTLFVPARDVPVVTPPVDAFRVHEIDEEPILPPLVDSPPPVGDNPGSDGREVTNGTDRGVGSVDGSVAPLEVIPPLKDYIPHDEIPVVVHRVLPEYPPLAQQAGLEGKVMVHVFVGVDGRVRGAEMVTPGSVFDEAALTAARQWVFAPAKANGHPVGVWMAIPIVFRLH